MGPYATQILGDMGADVIKVEAPDGDLFRHAAPMRHPAMGATYLNLNRNKRSIVLNLKQAHDLDILRRLVQKADVFVSSVRPQALRKLGLDYETLSAEHPRIIYCGVYGFSESGPYAGRPAFDDIIQAMSGLAVLQGNNDPEGPRYVNTIVADKTSGLTAAGAIAMALYERERSGQGQAVEVPMFETMVSFNWVEHLGGETFIPAEGDMGYGRVLSPHRRPYRTRDGYIGLMPYTNQHWHRFFTIGGRPELAADSRFADPASRSRNVGELYRILAEMVAERSTAEWAELLKGSDVPMTPVLSGEELLRDPHLREVGMFPEQEHPTEGPIRLLGIPVRFSRTPGSMRRPAPMLDRDRESILRELD
jgi:crotonobetainyl-CoA:carnitine CoA-transferase CaiB-like acyl-CoA transferase